MSSQGPGDLPNSDPLPPQPEGVAAPSDGEGSSVDSDNAAHGPPRVEDALSYLDRVKTRLASKPHIYVKFLEVMRDFRSAAIDTPGVIRKVQELFRGYNDLILGFNTFLPPGHKIKVTDLPGPSGGGPSSESGSGGGGDGGGSSRPSGSSSSSSSMSGSGSSSGGGAARTSSGGPPDGCSATAAPAVPVSVAGKPVASPLEFDHAMTYMTKIKRRFKDDPNTYKQFLEVLHKYHKQQRWSSIKDVLERVLVLFRDHPDLLQDFTYFLPDAAQEFARKRISDNLKKARSPSTDSSCSDEDEHSASDDPDGTPTSDRGGQPNHSSRAVVTTGHTAEPEPGHGDFAHDASPAICSAAAGGALAGALGDAAAGDEGRDSDSPPSSASMSGGGSFSSGDGAARTSSGGPPSGDSAVARQTAPAMSISAADNMVASPLTCDQVIADTDKITDSFADDPIMQRMRHQVSLLERAIGMLVAGTARKSSSGPSASSGSTS